MRGVWRVSFLPAAPPMAANITSRFGRVSPACKAARFLPRSCSSAPRKRGAGAGALRGLFLPGLDPGPDHSRSSRQRGAAQEREEAMTVTKLTALITASASLVLAIAKLVWVIRCPL